MKATPLQDNKNIKEIQKEISPQLYNDYLSHIHLSDIYVTDIQSKLFWRDFPGKAKLDFKEHPSIKKVKDDFVTIENCYELKAKSNNKRVFLIKINYHVEFHMDKSIPEDFFVLYNKYSLPLQTFPYFREYVNTILSRMGLPPLILPLRKNLIGSEE